MNKGRGLSAIPAQGRNDNCADRTDGAVATPSVRSLRTVMPGFTRPSGWHIGVMAAFLPLSLSAQSYFQQQVDYRINVRLDDVKHELHAYEEFDYLNNSPQTLDTLWIHLWPNAYKDPSTALCKQLDTQNDFGLHFATPEKRGYIDSLDFRSNDSKLTWGLDAKNIDIGWVKLTQPLAPGRSITITTPFHVKIPSASFSRLGHAGQAYYITQWFPKPAVFDPQGWHAMPYLTQGEFYSEFGSFDVSITLPKNYVVGATGELQTPSEAAWLDSIAASGDAITQAARRASKVLSDTAMKTIRYKQDRVHDFGWFADKRFIVQKGSVILPRTGHTVTTWTMFTPKNAKVWADAITYVNESVRLYSQWVGDYPYSACTAIDGGTAAGGGMEYPMITIINDSDDPFELDVVIAHEVGHNWFYGMLGSNEREHPWMDEGVNSYYEQRYVETRYPDKRLMDLEGIPLGFLTRGKGITYRQKNELQYRFNARRNWDSPPETPSAEFSFLDYGTTVYSKSALIFDQLRSYLGDSLFDASMQEYFADWSFKHPGPVELRTELEQISNKNLDWIFSDLIGANKKISIKAKRLSGSQYRFQSNIQAPLNISSWNLEDSLSTGWIENLRPVVLTREIRDYNRGRIKTDGYPCESRTYESDLWKATFTGLRIDAVGQTLDIDRRNHEVRAQGLFKRTKLPEVKFLAGLEREDRRSIFWTPAIAKNSHDGYMVGLALHNTTLPNQRFEWVAAPLYGTKSERLAGGARFMWHHDRLRSDLLRNVHVGVSGFAASLWSVGDVEQWYQRAVPSVQFDFRSKPNAAQTDLRFRSVIIWNHLADTRNVNDAIAQVSEEKEDIYHEVSLHHQRKNGLHPFDLSLTSLNHQAFNRLALDAKWSAIYDRHHHRVTFRGFGGVFLNKNEELMRPEFGWRLHWGSSDMLYDHLFLDRQYLGQNTAQQFAKDQGGFKTPTANGTSGTWIAALNMEADFPFRLPLSFFASYGASPVTNRDQYGNSTTGWQANWEAGIGVRIIRDVVEMWVPLAYSTDIQKEIEDQRSFDFTERIRFVFALEKMDPTTALRRAPH